MRTLVIGMTGLVTACTLFSPQPAKAWGDDGHYIVALIADQHLTPGTRTAVKNLLGNLNISDPDVPVWADVIKHKQPFESQYAKIYPGNSAYHYINLDVTKPDPTLDPGDPTHPKDVFQAVDRFRKDVINLQLQKERRQEALRFLVHFVGDLHQPLHCADMNDEGGNLRFVNFSPSQTSHDTVKLHAYWDTNLVHDVMAGLSREDTAGRLANTVSQSSATAWQKGDVKDWVLESKNLGKENAYDKANIQGDSGRDHKHPIQLDAAYIKNGRNVVAQQLQKGGVRLAKVLNEVFGD